MRRSSFQKANVGTLIGVRDDVAPKHDHLVSALEIVDRGNFRKLSTLELLFVGPHFIGQDADNRTNLISVASEGDDVIRKTETR